MSAYFKILFDFILKTNPTEVRKNPKILDPIFKNFEANEELLKFTDEAMQNYFINAEFYYSDLNDEEGKNVTWHNFFSNYAWDDDLRKRVDGFVKTEKERIKSIKNKF